MTVLLILLMFVAFVGLDFLVRDLTRRHRARKELEARKAVLETSVRLDFTHEAHSLKRVEVPAPRARILAVDDEPVVLDAFRRILVLEGYSVDTVETGPEALGLVQRHDYDFVFTDLKMPDMDGVEVVKAVKHLRPDVDVVVITGYATIETAVETLQQGACEYVQKPFTAEELADFAGKLVIKRQARLEAQRMPVVRIVAPEVAETVPAGEYCVPGGAFLSEGHAWARIEPGGQIRVGIDDFARKALGPVESVEAPEPGRAVRKGDPLFTLRRNGQAVHFASPVSGKVLKANPEVQAHADPLLESPYDRGWVCALQATDLVKELGTLRIGKPVVPWYQEEIKRLRDLAPERGGSPDWPAVEQAFLHPERETAGV
jgi:CheY-like chemotaxis protein